MSDLDSKDASVYRIGVVSDTHWHRAEQFDSRLEERLRGVDLILHAGDVVEPFVLARLSKIAPVRGVQGNCDGSDARAVLAQLLELEVRGVRIAMLHGHQGDPDRPLGYLELLREKPAVLVHGHSHKAVDRLLQGVRIFNPGSASQPRNHLDPSIGRFEIDSDGVLSAVHLSLVTGLELQL